MRLGAMSTGSLRQFRFVLGTALLLAGTALLMARGIAWLGF
jgi:ZIP family zinc transporter